MDNGDLTRVLAELGNFGKGRFGKKRWIIRRNNDSVFGQLPP